MNVDREIYIGKELYFDPDRSVIDDNLDKAWFIEAYEAYDFEWYAESLKNKRYESVEYFNQLVYSGANTHDNFIDTLFYSLSTSILNNYPTIPDIIGKYFSILHTGSTTLNSLGSPISGVINSKFYVY